MGLRFASHRSSCRLAARRANRAQTGMALVMVLWVITLLTVIAASFTLGMRREAGTIRHLVEVAQARALAEAGVRFAMLGLLETDETFAWKADGTMHRLTIGDIPLTIRVTGEAGRVDLNTGSPELIDGVLRQAGLEDENARAVLRDSILDWRDPSPDRRAAGLREADYRAAGREYGPANAPFRSLEELLLVPGVTPALYRRLLPMLTVHSLQSGVNFSVASEDVLMAVPGVDSAMVEAYVARREEARERGDPVPGFEGLGLGSDQGGAYSVQSIARTPSGLEQGLRVVLSSGVGLGHEPYTIVHYRWEEAP